MKTFDIVIWTLLTIGGLNWGLVGFFDVNLVEIILGEKTIASRVIYGLVGLAALYDIVGVKSIWKRWQMHFFKPAQA